MKHFCLILFLILFSFDLKSQSETNIEIGTGIFILDLMSNPLNTANVFYSDGYANSLRINCAIKKTSLYFGVGLNHYNYLSMGIGLFIGSNSELLNNSYYSSVIFGKNFSVLKKSSLFIQSSSQILLNRKQSITQRRIFTSLDFGGRFGIGESFYFLINVPIPITSMFYSNTLMVFGGSQENFTVRVENTGFQLGVGYKFNTN